MISTNYKWRQWYLFGVSQLVFEYLIALAGQKGLKALTAALKKK